MTSRQTALHTLVFGLWFALAGTEGVAQTLGEDPAFAAFRRASEAFARQEYGPAARLAHYLLGQAAMAEARWDEAIAALSTVVSLYPRCFVGHRDLGIALEQAQRLEEARTAYETARTILPHNPDAQARLAFLHLQAGRQEAALSLLKPLAERGTVMPVTSLRAARRPGRFLME